MNWVRIPLRCNYNLGTDYTDYTDSAELTQSAPKSL